MKSSAKRPFAGAIAWALLAASLAYAGWEASRSWDFGISADHGFRQAQTALSIRAMAEGGPWLAYETPVLGAPWAIPFEFPLYQAAVALTMRALGTPLPQTARLWTLLSFWLALLPAYRLARRFGAGTASARALCALLAVCPFYTHWNRAILIEAMALALSMVYLDQATEASACLGDASRAARLRRALGLGMVCGLGAVLIKPTTWLAFVVAWGLHFARPALAQLRAKKLDQVAVPLALLGVAPVVAMASWTFYADALKLENPLAADFLTSRALHGWVFGSWQQRWDAPFWRMLFQYTIPGALGNGWVAALGFPALLVVAWFCDRGRFKAMLSLAGLFFLPPLVFTNLFEVHTYYGYANAAFALAAVALGLTVLWDRWFRCGMALTVVWLAICVHRSSSAAVVDIHPYAPLARRIQQVTAPEDVLLVYGLDWDPQLSYYSQRRALMDRENLPLSHPKMKAALSELSQRGLRITAAVFCFRARAEEFMTERARALRAEKRHSARELGCELFSIR